MEPVIEIAKLIFSRSDPFMVGCFLLLAYWIHDTRRVLNKHLDSQNAQPHPQCKAHEDLFKALGEQLERQHTEAREDFKSLSDAILNVARNT